MTKKKKMDETSEEQKLENDEAKLTDEVNADDFGDS